MLAMITDGNGTTTAHRRTERKATGATCSPDTANIIQR